MYTKYALHAIYGCPAVPLRDLCEQFLGISPKTAQERANACALPIPTFKMEEGQRSPHMVYLNDLGDYIDRRREVALSDWRMVHG